MSEDTKILEGLGEYQYGFHDRDDYYTFKSQRGLNREVVENISRMKDEPQWMLDFRLKALEHYMARPMPNWGPHLQELDLDNIFYYVKPTEKSEKSWDDVPDDIKNTFNKLGIPEAEQKFLAGVGAQYESEMVYHSIQKHLEEQGVIFLSIEDGLKEYPTCSANISVRSSRLKTTSWPRSTRQSGRAARSFMCRKASMSICPCRHISA
jgi:Fe-S cluster assembly protein SufB